MGTDGIYTHEVPKIDSIIFRKIKQGRYAKGTITTIDVYANPLTIDFEFHMYREVVEDVYGHLILRWRGHELVLNVKFYPDYNIRIFACPLGCKRYTTHLYFLNEQWGCKKCLKLKVDSELMRARRLANNPDRLFGMLRNAKRANRRGVGFIALFLLKQLFYKALKKKLTTTKGLRI